MQCLFWSFVSDILLFTTQEVIIHFFPLFQASIHHSRELYLHKGALLGGLVLS